MEMCYSWLLEMWSIGGVLWRCAACGLLVYMEREIVGYLKISMSYDSFWAFVQNTTGWWCTNYPKLFCNDSLLMIISNWRA